MDRNPGLRAGLVGPGVVGSSHFLSGTPRPELALHPGCLSLLVLHLGVPHLA